LPILIAALAVSCADPRPVSDRRAFFHWRTTLAPAPAELDVLRETRAERLYVRVFDVDRLNHAVAPAPIARVSVPSPIPFPASLELVPAVFLRERVFHVPAPDLDALVWSEVVQAAARMGRPYRELLVDCDWTDSTRDTFFEFVRGLSARAARDGVEVTATIRLHQVKFRERTGVPPVKRGLLMFYSMGRLGPEPGDRSIFSADAARPYLERLHDYPLALDLALPAFSWVVQVREGRVVDLLQSADPAEVAACPGMRVVGPDRVRAGEDGFCAGVFVRRDDELQGEVVDAKVAVEAARMVSAKLSRGSAARTVGLFELSPRSVKRFGASGFSGVFDAMR